MSRIETADEEAAQAAAWKVWLEDDPDFRYVGFPIHRAGWLAGRDYARQQDQADVADAIHEVEQSTKRWANLTRSRQQADPVREAAQRERLEEVVTKLVTSLRDVTNELQAWHDERPDSPELRDLCVSCGYLEQARTALALAEEAP